MALAIERLDFAPWGCFEDLSLRFSSRVGDVDLIYGPNAAGKSTTSRGERSLLYGIEERTPDNHTYDYADLRIGARLRLDGSSVELSRRKRRSGSLVAPGGQSLPEDSISSALGGLTEAVYRALFQIDHDTLVQGGAELLQGEGEIGTSLFAAAAGIATLHGTLAELDTEAERIFNPRARKTVLHKALVALREADRRLRVATLRPARHREMALALTAAQAACKELTCQMRELDLGARAIERRRAIAPLLDARADRVGELQALAGTPDLPSSAATQRADAQGRVQGGAAALERIRGVAAKLEQEIERIEVDEAIIVRGDEIRAIKESAPATSKAAADRRKREGELAEARAGLEGAAQIAGVEPDEIEELRRPATARRALDGCLREREQRGSRRTSAQARMEDATRARDDARDELQAADAERRGAGLMDVHDLDAAMTAALKVVPLSEQISELRLAVELSRDEAAERFSRLSPASSSLDVLRTLAAPSREQAARAVAHSDELRRAAEELRSEASRLAGVESELVQERERLILEGEPPSAQALAVARGLRDGHWSAIRDASGDGSRLSGCLPFSLEDAERFERALTDADRVADARTDHAAQIERAAAVGARAARTERERAGLLAREQELRDRRVRLNDEWEQAWRVTGLAVIAPEDAPGWLDEREAILGLIGAAAQAQARAGALADRERGHRDALVAQVRVLGHEVPSAAGLDTLLSRARGVIDQAREQASARCTAASAVAGAERALVVAQGERDCAAQARSGWEDAWPERRAQAGLPASATPDGAQEIARAVDEGLAHLKRIADLERRIAGIDADRASFEDRVRRLCEDSSPELTALDAQRAAGVLGAKLTEHEDRLRRCRSLSEQRQSMEEELAATEIAVGVAKSEIDALIAAAGAEHAGELPRIEARAARAGALREEIAEIERQVAQVGEGRFAELAQGMAGFDRERAAQELDELRQHADEVSQEREQVTEQIGERKRELGEAETDTAAVRAAQDVELARSECTQAAIAYAKARLAATVVRRAIERYRRLHQDPLLRRANELFGRFTLGSFVELFVDIDERGQGVLIGRQRDRVRKRVPQMSKGTREQLFLALRIAAIERYVATSGPVPVIFDDVFIESDEPRSERIFGALGELATKTQVIVLTHHHHLIAVGRRALADKLVVQDLPDGAPALREAAAA